MQADVLDRRPDNGQTTGFGREGDLDAIAKVV